MTATRADQIESLARQFTWELLGEIGGLNFRHAVEKNKAYGSACASHDYCDANMVMLDAFRIAIGREVDDNDEGGFAEADTELISEAWDRAKVIWPTIITALEALLGPPRE